MPANRVPLNILRLKNARPSRIKARENEPIPENALGEPPKHLTKGERRCWRELVRTAPYGVIGDCDSWSVEMASCLMAEYRADRAAITATRLNLLHSIMGRFGFTPADRSRVQVPQLKEKIPFDDDW